MKTRYFVTSMNKNFKFTNDSHFFITFLSVFLTNAFWATKDLVERTV